MSPATPLHAGEQAAREARAELGVDPDSPLTDIVRVIEGHDIPVFLTEMPRDVAGFARRVSPRWFIVANGVHVPRRQRFTLAHELAHARLEHVPRLDRVEHLRITEAHSMADQQEV